MREEVTRRQTDKHRIKPCKILPTKSPIIQASGNKIKKEIPEYTFESPEYNLR